MKLFMYVIGQIQGAIKTLLAALFIAVELAICVLALGCVCYNIGIEGMYKDREKILERGWKKVKEDIKGKPKKKIVKEDGYTL